MNKLSLLCVCCAILLSTSAKSDLISTDWQSAGDGLITRDTQTELEWLDVDQTFGWSYQDVVSEFGSGGLFEGFRHATLTELVTLHSNAGLTQHSQIIFPEDENEVADYLIIRGPELIPYLDDDVGSIEGYRIKSITGTQASPLDHWQSNVMDIFGLYTIVKADFTPYPDTSSDWNVGHELVRITVAPITLVTIDIKPGSYPNCFNINSHGIVPVAIIGTEEFDVTEIDLASLSFGGLEVRMRGNKGPLCSADYSNDDPYLDLICHFEDDSSMWAPGNGEATLTGNLIDGTNIEGSDSICMVP